jgi:GDP-4-dehydro-6-deoxy-D-mannose reductase
LPERVVTSLVTGAAGFAGQHLVRELLQSGHAVVGGTLDGAPPTSGLLDTSELESVRWVELDVTCVEQTRAVVWDIAPDRVFHLAAQSSVGFSFSDVVGTWTANATGTLQLLCVLAETANPPRLLFISSSEVYGTVPELEQPIRESRPMSPSNPYGASKAAAEIVVRQMGVANDLHVVIARSFNHTGPGQSTSFALPNWAEQLGAMARGEVEPLLRVGNLEVWRDLLDVRDVVRAYRLLIENGDNGGVYNVCKGEAHCLRQVIETMVELSGTGARIEVDEKRLRPVDTPLIQGDPKRIRALGWSPRIEIRQTLADLLGHAAAQRV